jgi:3-phosphoshikimate 1-carboxyvinyltransferase
VQERVIDAGNSGQVLRFVGAAAALSEASSWVGGDASICQRRPVKPLLEGLTQWGAKASSLSKEGFAPIRVQGPLKGGEAYVEGADSQPISGLLMAAALLEGKKSCLRVAHPGACPWVELTLSWLRRLGHRIEQQGYTDYEITGGPPHAGFTYRAPGDWSSAAFPIALAFVTHSSLILHDLDPDDVQGDRLFIELVRLMGGRLEWKGRALHVEGGELRGIEVDVNSLIDALPILAVLGCYAKGEMRLVNGAMARHKESDRIAAIGQELRRMGAAIEEREDGLTIRSSSLKGAALQSHADHRIAMALTVAALGAQGESTLEGSEWMVKSYPDFVSTLKKLGAKIDEQ